MVGHLHTAIRTLVIIPTYNEAPVLPTLLHRLLTLPISLDLLVVDDASPDGTGAIARAIAIDHPQVRVLRRPRRHGYRSAIEAGLRYAMHHRYPYALQMDADLSHNPDSIAELLGAMSHADLALGSRYDGGIRCYNWTIGRLLISYYGNRYLATFTQMPFHDITTGFRCYRTSALAAIDVARLRSRGYAILPELVYTLWRQGARIVEVPILFAQRTAGSSKLSAAIALEVALLPYRLATSNRRPRAPRRATPHNIATTIPD